MADSGITPEANGQKAAVSVRRLVNDSTAEVAERLDNEGGTVFEFICECGDLSCSEKVTLTLAEYRTYEPGSVIGHA